MTSYQNGEIWWNMFARGSQLVEGVLDVPIGGTQAWTRNGPGS